MSAVAHSGLLLSVGHTDVLNIQGKCVCVVSPHLQGALQRKLAARQAKLGQDLRRTGGR